MHISKKLLLILFFAIIFLYCLNPLKEPDSFYHLKTGEVIWQTKSIPHADIFSSTAPGSPWITHEWLAQLLFYGVYSLGNFWALIIFVAFIAIATYLFIFALARLRGSNFYISLLLLFLLGYLTFELWIPRPQIFGYLAFAVLLFCLERYKTTRLNRYLGWAVLVMWLWANMHASFLLGILIFTLYAAAEYAASRYREVSSRLSARPFLIACSLAIIVSFINPNSYKVFLYSFDIQSAIGMLHVSEWKSILFFWDLLQTKVFLIEMIVADIFLVWWLLRSSSRRDDIWIGLVIFISALPFLAIRHVGFWPLVAIAPLSLAVTDVLERSPAKQYLKYSGTICAVVGLLFLGIWFLRAHTFPVNAKTIPVDAVNFIETNNIHGPFFNLYNDGGYLIWRLWPGEHTFIDGRSEIYPKEVIKEFLLIALAKENFWELIDIKYNFNYFVLSYRTTSIAQAILPLVENLMKKNWVLIYWDDVEIIFVRNIPQNKQLIEKYGLVHVSPFRDATKIPTSELDAVKSELEVLSRRSSQTDVLQEYADMIIKSHTQ